MELCKNYKFNCFQFCFNIMPIKHCIKGILFFETKPFKTIKNHSNHGENYKQILPLNPNFFCSYYRFPFNGLNSEYQTQLIFEFFCQLQQNAKEVFQNDLLGDLPPIITILFLNLQYFFDEHSNYRNLQTI